VVGVGDQVCIELVGVGDQVSIEVVGVGVEAGAVGVTALVISPTTFTS